MNSKNNKFITFGSPNIQKSEINEVVKTLKSGWIGTGPKVKKFEANLREAKPIIKQITSLIW